MAKPIRMTEEVKKKVYADFLASLEASKLADGKFKYETTLGYDKTERAKVIFSPIAFAKMTRLLLGFTTEVAWHGTVERSAENARVFYIKDIMVYPQTVTGATVNTDQTRYSDWLDSFDDEVFNSIRMQGHSHVNFSTNPSTTDLDHQERIIGQLTGEHFYIFMIFNQKFERHIKIYDYPNNILFENADIDISVGEQSADIEAFFADAQKQVTRTYSTAYQNTNAGYQYTTPANPKNTKSGTQPNKTKTTVAGGGYTVPPANAANQQPAGILNENHFSYARGYDYDGFGD